MLVVPINDENNELIWFWFVCKDKHIYGKCFMTKWVFVEYALLLEMHLFLYMVCSDELDIFLERKNSTLFDQDYEHAGWCGSWPSI